MGINEIRKYRSWKLHFAIVISSMVAATVIVALRMVLFGFDPVWLLMIPLFPPLVYATTFLLCILFILVTESGLGAICFFGWKLIKYLYREINSFFEMSEKDREFCWSEYFWGAFCLLLSWLLIVLATYFIIGGVHNLIIVGKHFFELK